MTLVHRHRVRYHEADAQGYLFNSRFLELADVGLTEYFRAVGLPYAELVAEGCDPSVAKAEIDYLRPARFDDVLDVDVMCTHVGHSSFRITTALLRGETAIASMRLVYVNVNAASETSKAIPERVANLLRTSMQPDPA